MDTLCAVNNKFVKFSAKQKRACALFHLLFYAFTAAIAASRLAWSSTA